MLILLCLSFVYLDHVFWQIVCWSVKLAHLHLHLKDFEFMVLVVVFLLDSFAALLLAFQQLEIIRIEEFRLCSFVVIDLFCQLQLLLILQFQIIQFQRPMSNSQPFSPDVLPSFRSCGCQPFLKWFHDHCLSWLDCSKHSSVWFWELGQHFVEHFEVCLLKVANF